MANRVGEVDYESGTSGSLYMARGPLDCPKLCGPIRLRPSYPLPFYRDGTFVSWEYDIMADRVKERIISVDRFPRWPPNLTAKFTIEMPWLRCSVADSLHTRYVWYVAFSRLPVSRNRKV